MRATTMLRDDMEQAPANMEPVYHLMRIGPPATRPIAASVMHFTKPVTIIGRQITSCDYILTSDNSIQRGCISRRHARVIRRHSQYKLYDDSLNGIFVNNYKIDGCVTLVEGDTVTFGHPGGTHIMAGTRTRQPDSEHQFLGIQVDADTTIGDLDKPGYMCSVTVKPDVLTLVPLDTDEASGQSNEAAKAKLEPGTDRVAKIEDESAECLSEEVKDVDRTIQEAHTMLQSDVFSTSLKKHDAESGSEMGLNNGHENVLDTVLVRLDGIPENETNDAPGMDAAPNSIEGGPFLLDETNKIGGASEKVMDRAEGGSVPDNLTCVPESASNGSVAEKESDADILNVEIASVDVDCNPQDGNRVEGIVNLPEVTDTEIMDNLQVPPVEQDPTMSQHETDDIISGMSDHSIVLPAPVFIQTGENVSHMCEGTVNENKSDEIEESDISEEKYEACVLQLESNNENSVSIEHIWAIGPSGEQDSDDEEKYDICVKMIEQTDTELNKATDPGLDTEQGSSKEMLDYVEYDVKTETNDKTSNDKDEIAHNKSDYQVIHTQRPVITLSDAYLLLREVENFLSDREDCLRNSNRGEKTDVMSEEQVKHAHKTDVMSEAQVEDAQTEKTDVLSETQVMDALTENNDVMSEDQIEEAHTEKRDFMSEAHLEDGHTEKSDVMSEAQVEDAHTAKTDVMSEGQVVDAHTEKSDVMLEAQVEDAHTDKSNVMSEAQVEDAHTDKSNVMSEAKVVDAHTEKTNVMSEAQVEDAHTGKTDFMSEVQVEDSHTGKSDVMSEANVEDAHTKKTKIMSEAQVDAHTEKTDDMSEANVEDVHTEKTDVMSEAQVESAHTKTDVMSEAQVEDAHTENSDVMSEANVEDTHTEKSDVMSEPQVKVAHTNTDVMSVAQVEVARTEKSDVMSEAQVEDARTETDVMSEAQVEDAHTEKSDVMSEEQVEDAHTEKSDVMSEAQVEDAHTKTDVMSEAQVEDAHTEKSDVMSEVKVEDAHTEKSVMLEVQVEDAHTKTDVMSEAQVEDAHSEKSDVMSEEQVEDAQTEKSDDMSEVKVEDAHTEKSVMLEVQVEDAHTKTDVMSEAQVEDAHPKTDVMSEAQVEDAHTEKSDVMSEEQVEDAQTEESDDMSEVKVEDAHTEKSVMLEVQVEAAHTETDVMSEAQVEDAHTEKSDVMLEAQVEDAHTKTDVMSEAQVEDAHTEKSDVKSEEQIEDAQTEKSDDMSEVQVENAHTEKSVILEVQLEAAHTETDVMSEVQVKDAHTEKSDVMSEAQVEDAHTKTDVKSEAQVEDAHTEKSDVMSEEQVEDAQTEKSDDMSEVQVEDAHTEKSVISEVQVEDAHTENSDVMSEAQVEDAHTENSDVMSEANVDAHTETDVMSEAQVVDAHTEKTDVMSEAQVEDAHTKTDVMSEAQVEDAHTEKSDVMSEANVEDAHTEKSDVMLEAQVEDAHTEKSDVMSEANVDAHTETDIMSEAQVVDAHTEKTEVMSEAKVEDAHTEKSDVMLEAQVEDAHTEKSEVMSEAQVEVAHTKTDVMSVAQVEDAHTEKSGVMSEAQVVDAHTEKTEVMSEAQVEDAHTKTDVMLEAQVDAHTEKSGVMLEAQVEEAHTEKTDVMSEAQVEEAHTEKSDVMSEAQVEVAHTKTDVMSVAQVEDAHTEKSGVMSEAQVVDAHTEKTEVMSEAQVEDAHTKTDVMLEAQVDAHTEKSGVMLEAQVEEAHTEKTDVMSKAQVEEAHTEKTDVMSEAQVEDAHTKTDVMSEAQIDDADTETTDVMSELKVRDAHAEKTEAQVGDAQTERTDVISELQMGMVADTVQLAEDNSTIDSSLDKCGGTSRIKEEPRFSISGDTTVLLSRNVDEVAVEELLEKCGHLDAKRGEFVVSIEPASKIEDDHQLSITDETTAMLKENVAEGNEEDISQKPDPNANEGCLDERESSLEQSSACSTIDEYVTACSHTTSVSAYFTPPQNINGLDSEGDKSSETGVLDIVYKEEDQQLTECVTLQESSCKSQGGSDGRPSSYTGTEEEKQELISCETTLSTLSSLSSCSQAAGTIGEVHDIDKNIGRSDLDNDEHTEKSQPLTQPCVSVDNEDSSENVKEEIAVKYSAILIDSDEETDAEDEPQRPVTYLDLQGGDSNTDGGEDLDNDDADDTDNTIGRDISFDEPPVSDSDAEYKSSPVKPVASSKRDLDSPVSTSGDNDCKRPKFDRSDSIEYLPEIGEVEETPGENDLDMSKQCISEKVSTSKNATTSDASLLSEPTPIAQDLEASSTCIQTPESRDTLESGCIIPSISVSVEGGNQTPAHIPECFTQLWCYDSDSDSDHVESSSAIYSEDVSMVVNVSQDCYRIGDSKLIAVSPAVSDVRPVLDVTSEQSTSVLKQDLPLFDVPPSLHGEDKPETIDIKDPITIEMEDELADNNRQQCNDEVESEPSKDCAESVSPSAVNVKGVSMLENVSQVSSQIMDSKLTIEEAQAADPIKDKTEKVVDNVSIEEAQVEDPIKDKTEEKVVDNVSIEEAQVEDPIKDKTLAAVADNVSIEEAQVEDPIKDKTLAAVVDNVSIEEAQVEDPIKDKTEEKVVDNDSIEEAQVEDPIKEQTEEKVVDNDSIEDKVEDLIKDKTEEEVVNNVPIEEAQVENPKTEEKVVMLDNDSIDRLKDTIVIEKALSTSECDDSEEGLQVSISAVEPASTETSVANLSEPKETKQNVTEASEVSLHSSSPTSAESFDSRVSESVSRPAVPSASLYSYETEPGVSGISDSSLIKVVEMACSNVAHDLVRIETSATYGKRKLTVQCPGSSRAKKVRTSLPGNPTSKENLVCQEQGALEACENDAPKLPEPARRQDTSLALAVPTAARTCGSENEGTDVIALPYSPINGSVGDGKKIIPLPYRPSNQSEDEEKNAIPLPYSSNESDVVPLSCPSTESESEAKDAIPLPLPIAEAPLEEAERLADFQSQGMSPEIPYPSSQCHSYHYEQQSDDQEITPGACSTSMAAETGCPANTQSILEPPSSPQKRNSDMPVPTPAALELNPDTSGADSQDDTVPGSDKESECTLRASDENFQEESSRQTSPRDHSQEGSVYSAPGDQPDYDPMGDMDFSHSEPDPDPLPMFSEEDEQFTPQSLKIRMPQELLASDSPNLSLKLDPKEHSTPMRNTRKRAASFPPSDSGSDASTQSGAALSDLVGRIQNRKRSKFHFVPNVEVKPEPLVPLRQRNAVHDDKAESHVKRLKEIVVLAKDTLSENINLAEKPRVGAWLKEMQEMVDKAAVPRTVIAIVGDTGSGKSTLMNALLGHAAILPTSGMRACTAVVVEIENNPKPGSYVGEIEFLSQGEWYDELRNLLDDLKGADGLVRARCPDSCKDSYVSWHKIRAVYGPFKDGTTFEDLLRIRSVTRMLGLKRVVTKSEAIIFRNSINHYIESNDTGSGGQHWPIVKRVKLKIPCSVLSSGAVLVDLPGIRDANAARDKIAKEYLQNCTAVWVAAGVQRAVDNKTAKDLLGEHFKRQLLMDGQYGSVGFICTKTDVLCSSELRRALNVEAKVMPHENAINEMCAEDDRLRDQIAAAEQKVLEARAEKKAKEADLKELLLAVNRETQNPEDVSESFNTAQTLIEETRIEVAELEEKITATLLDIKADKKQKRQLDSKNKIAEHRRSVAAICAEARNEFARRQIKEDFKAGLKELRRTGVLDEEDEDEHYSEDESDADESGGDFSEINQTVENLKVFCVSSTEYLKLTGCLPPIDGEAAVFRTLDECGIPALESHVHVATKLRRRRGMERMITNLTQMINDIHTYLTQEGAECARSRNQVQAIVLQEIENLKSGKLGNALERTMLLIEESIGQNIHRRIKAGCRSAAKSADATVSKWNAKHNAKDRKSGGLHLATYKSVVKNDGVFNSPTFGAIDFNKELSEPIYASISVEWNNIFNNVIGHHIDQFRRMVHEAIAKFKPGVVLLGQQVVAPELLQRCSRSLTQRIEITLAEMTAVLKSYVTEQQRDINRVITPGVQGQMQAAYARCTQESGNAMFIRMKKHISSYVSEEKHTIFDEASQIMISLIVDLEGNIRKALQNVVEQVIGDCIQIYEPLWETGTKDLRVAYLEGIVECVKAVQILASDANVKLPDALILSPEELDCGSSMTHSTIDDDLESEDDRLPQKNLVDVVRSLQSHCTCDVKSETPGMPYECVFHGSAVPSTRNPLILGSTQMAWSEDATAEENCTCSQWPDYCPVHARAATSTPPVRIPAKPLASRDVNTRVSLGSSQSSSYSATTTSTTTKKEPSRKRSLPSSSSHSPRKSGSPGRLSLSKQRQVVKSEPGVKEPASKRRLHERGPRH